MSEAQHAPEGQVIEGRYRVVSRIADGGMATVYQAVDERLGRTVAIKIMHTQLAQGPQRDQFVERFHREARSAAAIANPHIVQVYDTGEFDGLDFLVMEYVHGVNLRYEMNQQVTFSVRETLRIVGETLDGLASAHRAGVVHRDIKPENILLNDRGHVQITDFGLAKAVSQATLSSTGMLLGTAAYLAPEMIQHNQATPQGDLYSVGIMAWEMLAGNPVTLVFKHVHEDVPDITTACPGINTGVAAFLARLTARAVEDRPQDASVAFDELQQLQSNLTIDDWQYRLSAVSPAANDAADTMPGDGTRQMPLPQHRLCVRTTIVHDSSIRKTRTKPPSCRRSRQIRRQPPAWLWKRTTSPPTTFQLPPRTVRSVVDSRNAVASVHLSSSPS
jgi:serine/threonine protein kinase